MTSPRLAPLEPPYAPDLAEALAAMMPPGVAPLRLFRTLAHNPRILGKMRAANLLDRGSLERREREIVILRATARAGAEYEWGLHAGYFAGRVGLDDARVAATVHGGADAPAWTPRERLLVRLVDSLHDTARLDDALWNELAAAYEPAQLVELVVLAGFYRTISCVVNAFGLEHEDGAPHYPPKTLP
ncbi:MAG TPA: carboxymuconolactone decarboxylase family protein [Myxococcota bacterium]|jgi:alkylhydroperoxidase family enzyme|nr:carboxymuconolactone decarboxylase family protein [Myxococcota bacterium]